MHDRELQRDGDGSFEVIIGAHPTGPNTITIDDTVGSLMTRGFEAMLTNLRGALARYPRPAGTDVFDGASAVNEFEDPFELRPDAVTTWGNFDANHPTMAFSLGVGESLVIDGGPIVERAADQATDPCRLERPLIESRHAASGQRRTLRR